MGSCDVEQINGSGKHCQGDLRSIQPSIWADGTFERRAYYRKRGGLLWAGEMGLLLTHCTPDTITKDLRFPEVLLRDGYL